MVAHAALVSLILHPAAGARRIFHNRAQLNSLHEKVSFLLGFLDKFSSRRGKSEDPELNRLETMIRKAAYDAEDVIESDIRNQLAAEPQSVLIPCVRVCLLLAFCGVSLFRTFPCLIDDVIRVFVPVLCVLLNSLQLLAPPSLQILIFVMSRVFIPLVIHILVRLSFFIVVVAESVMLGLLLPPEVMSIASKYWLYAHQLENQDLRGAIDDISSIVNDVVKIKDGRGSGQCWENQTQNYGDGLSRVIGKDVVVGLDGDLNEIIARLIGYPSELEIMTISGMGGIGKTTLARQVYNDLRIVDHFDICAWVTVSQEYSLRRVMLGLLSSAKIRTEEILQNHRDDELDHMLGDHLYKNLMSRRYLVVVDDMWDTEIWDFVRRYLPDNQNGSRVILTTRLSQVTSSAYSLQMGFLNASDSWDLLREKVFGGEGCSQELEDIGRTIARDCGGLPLAIVVVGGLLYNEHRTEGDWMCVSKDLHSVLSKDDDQCLEILGLSYNHLPHRLKPCFLYMGGLPGRRGDPCH